MSGFSRRRFLLGATGAAALTMLPTAPQAVAARPPAPGHCFRHGVASGDPLPDAVVLWTRVTPDPDAVPGSGLGGPVTVRWEISRSDRFDPVVAAGTVTTDATGDHTVKIDATGLSPATDYLYRFTVTDGAAAGTVSRTGRTRTAPAPDTDPGNLRFGVCSCANYEAGYFRAYRDMADRGDLDFTLHLGDFTYEYATGVYGGAHDEVVRRVQPPHRTTTLSDFRVRQGHYHLDPDLADLLAARPLVAVWDDHEFADNAWRDGATGDSVRDGDDYPSLRAGAAQAYLEWMPVRSRPVQRRLQFGTLADLIIPDLRSYRDEQQEVPAAWLPGTGAGDPDRTMTGSAQFDWFAGALSGSDTRWQLIGTSVMFSPMTLPESLDPGLHSWLVSQIGLPADGLALNPDQWDGYMAERRRIIDLVTGDGSSPARGGVVFLTGDIHSSWAADVPVDVGRWRTAGDRRVAATEFVTPSVTAASAFDGLASSPGLDAPVRALLRAGEEALKQVDSWFRYVDLTRHGYMAVDVTADRVHVDWHHGDVSTPDAPLARTTGRLALHGSPGAVPAPGPLGPRVR